MRIKSHWFKESAKTPEEIAGAAAFIAWRIAQDALKTMRAAGYELAPGARYFAFMREILIFVTLGADRIAHARGDEAWRVAFTTALANRAGEILAENESDLLGATSAREVKREFVALVNDCSAQCAACTWDEHGPDYGFLRFLGHRVADVMEDRDRSWAISQMIEVQGPDAAANLRRGMAGLTGTQASRRSGGAHASTGE